MSARFRVVVPFLAAALAASLLAVPVGAASVGRAPAVPSASPISAAPINPKTPKAVFFAADGLRQDLIPKYLGFFSTMNLMYRFGTKAAGDGLRTQAPPNTGAGWYSLATGAWSGVHGSTNNTFHINGQPFGPNRTAAFDPNVLQAETIAQAAERGGLKVAQVEWAGGRNGVIDGPTIDFRTFLSGRGVTTNFIGVAGEPLFDDDPFIRAFGLQFDHPAGYAGQDPFPAAAPTPATGWTGALPQSFSQPMEMRMRVLDFGTDKYGLNAYIYDSKNNGKTDYDRVLFSKTKDAAGTVADLRQGETADVKVTVQGGALNGLTAGFLVKVEVLSPDLSRVRLFHTSVSRANATWPSWPGEAGFTGDFAEFLAQRFPTSTAADFAVLEAGVVSEETYVEQGKYWSTAHVPMMEYVGNTYQPDLLLVGMPTTDEFQHQFLGLITKTVMGGGPNPAYDDVDLNGVPDGRVRQREGFIRDAYREADEVLSKARKLMGINPTTFVSSDHGFAPQFLALDASEPLKKLGLLSANQTSNCRTATSEAIGSAKACWAGGALQIYLNVAGRDPAPSVSSTIKQIPANQVDAKVAEIKAAYLGLNDPTDWTGDGAPEGWKVIDRVFSKAEARYIPNGPGSTADMAHPTRTGDVVVFSMPPYQWDAATPGTLISPSHFFGQHGYVPDLQDLSANVNMRATFLAGGQGIRLFHQVEARSIDLAPTLAYLLGIPEPQHSQGRVLKDVFWLGGLTRAVNIIGLTDFHGQLSPTTSAFDAINQPVGGAAFLKTMFDEEIASLGGGDALILAAGDNVGASPPNSLLLEDIPTIEALNEIGLDATAFGNHEFDYGVTRIITQQAVANFPWLAANIVEEATGVAPPWVDPTQVFTVNGVRVGVIGAELLNTPELVSAGNTEGLIFLPEAERIAAESEKLRQQGVLVQVVVIHQGTNVGRNRVGSAPAQAWDGPILGIADALQGTTVDAMIVGHTHRVSNLMRGKILIVEGVNAGASYSVLQLMVQGRDVEWAGGATRVAKNIGVAPNPAVQAIIQAADDETAPLRNEVVGTQVDDIRRDPTRLHESEMGNMVADAMRAAYPEVQAALVNSGGLRADLVFAPPSGIEAPGEITWGEMFTVLPFGNRTALMTVTGAQLRAAFLNGFIPFCDPAFAGGTGRFPQVSGLKVVFHCNGTAPVLDELTLVPDGPTGVTTTITDTVSVRLVTLDFLYTGGDGYTMFAGATDVSAPDTLLDVVIAYIRENSPVNPQIEGRITNPPT